MLVRGGYYALNEAGNQGGALWNAENSTLSVRDATFSTNTAAGGDGVGDDDGPDGGGAIYNDGGVADVRDAIFFRNEATGDAGTGGAIFNDAGRLRVIGGSFNRNVAPRAGGAIEVMGGDADIVNARLLSNGAGTPMTAEESMAGNPGNGGAVHVSGEGVATVSGGDARQNFAANQGGAFWNGVDGVLRLLDMSITNNEAAGGDSGDGGGAVYNDSDGGGAEEAGQLRIDDVFAARNTATGDEGSGGALLLAGGTTIVRDSNFASNSAVRAGGGIEMLGGDLRVRDSFLRNNMAGDPDLELDAAPGNGGGIHVVGGDDSLAIFSGGGIFGNDAANEGGGVWVGDGARVVLQDDLTLRGNEAPLGGGVYVEGGRFDARRDVTIRSNVAERDGGGLFIEDDDAAAYLQDVNVTDNVAGRGEEGEGGEGGGEEPAVGEGGGAFVGSDGLLVLRGGRLLRQRAGPDRRPGRGPRPHRRRRRPRRRGRHRRRRRRRSRLTCLPLPHRADRLVTTQDAAPESRRGFVGGFL